MNSLLKFITCGSVDDGKSTLIGHMLYDSKLIFADQKQALELDSKIGSNEGGIDYSFLLDGLMAEREQGITIDVAYRYFTTEKRSFIVADCPGHEQYTRNMAVGASFADLAVILADASKGILPQTRRHARICALMGIKHFVLAVNKMDLVGYSQEEFENIKGEFLKLISSYSPESVHAIPVCATVGDNVTTLSINTPWYTELPLLSLLEKADTSTAKMDNGFVIPVQRVSRPNHTFRGFQGQVEKGEISIGDKITVLPGGEQATVSKIIIDLKDENKAFAGQPVTICTNEEVDISRGCVLVRGKTPEVTDMITAQILWMDNHELIEGRNYILKCATKSTTASVMNIKYKTDINTGKHIAAHRLEKNEIAHVDIVLGEKITVDKFANDKTLGSFILIDRVTHMTSACGVIEHTLRRSENVVWHKTDITPELRANQKHQKPMTLWFTGLSGSGKSTLANEVEKRLFSLGKHTILLDGDNVRHGLNKNLGFKEEDRVENIRRISEVAKLMNDAGLIAITSFISPYEKDRESARHVIGDSFVEVYVSTPLEECERRDVKGLYKKARSGEIPNFTGISSPYEKPEKPEIEIDTTNITIDDATDYIMDKLKQYL